MGKLIEQNKLENIDKIKVGSCLELVFLFDNLETDFEKIKNFITENSKYFNNQTEYTLTKNIDDFVCLLDNNIDIILADIDKTENYCMYHSRYY